MKALSLTQPWASLVVMGAKKIETRSWSTDYRGPLAIHASKGFPKAAQALALNVAMQRGLGGALPFSLPRGAVLGIVNLTDVHRVATDGRLAPDVLRRFNAAPDEEEFGDYSSDDRWAWMLPERVWFERPMPAKGALGLWDWEPPEGELKLSLMCELCTYVYRASYRPGYYEAFGSDRACRGAGAPGVLVAAPWDAKPGSYYDPKKDPMLTTSAMMRR